jgi:uncharacterized protein
MSESTERALLDFTERKLSHASQLLITWFGGEPTLCMPIITRLQRGFAKLAERFGVEMEPASIITNGYLLDRTLAMRLKALGVTTAQVTVDGPERVHDARRRLRNGGKTFQRIMDNIAETSEILDIVVRINVDGDNIESASEVIHQLHDRGLLPGVNAHFARVTASGAACSSVQDRCFTSEEFSGNLARLYRRLFEEGISLVDYPQVFAGGHCGAVSQGSYVVSPTGSLFACWEELSLNTERSIGDIFGTTLEPHQQENRQRYQSWDPFLLSECRACDILPVCMGGCPIQGMRDGNKNKGVCSPYKHNLREMITLRSLCNERKEVTE